VCVVVGRLGVVVVTGSVCVVVGRLGVVVVTGAVVVAGKGIAPEAPDAIASVSTARTTKARGPLGPLIWARSRGLLSRFWPRWESPTSTLGRRPGTL